MKASSSHRGFTLLELLTTVVIVGLLVALIVPSLSGVRDRANTAGCVSNLRSVGNLMTLYAADHDGYLPIPLDDDSSKTWPYGTNKQWPYNSWMGQLAPYASITIKMSDSYEQKLRDTNSGVFRCPGKKDWKLVGTGSTERTRTSYVMNSFDINNTKGIQLKLVSIPEPARTMLVADTGGDYCVLPNNYPMYNDSRYIALRHQNADNVLFCDGHVQAVKSGGLDVNLVLKR